VTRAVGEHALVAITGGQCLEQLGSAEAYMPVLEAVGRLVREGGVPRALLRRYAPTWFAQLPWLIEEDDRDRLGRELLGGARERMLREIAEFTESLGAAMPLVLVLEDLHWSDPSTVDLLSLLATRREPARLLVLATYRPVDLILAQHPLRLVVQKLAASRLAAEIAVEELGADAVADYLRTRFAGGRFPSDVARLLRTRSDGNPLFMVTLVDHLLAHGAIVERDARWQVEKGFRERLAGVPESLRLSIEQQLERLTAQERQILEGASLAGMEFSTATAAAAADRGTADVEERCEHLAAAGPFLRRAGSTTWPDGTVSERFAFRHALYRDTLAATMPARRKAEAHRRIGIALEAAYGERASELGAELALHFEEGGDRTRAARYRRMAGETAARRYAFAEAEIHLEKGLALLADLPSSAERDREEHALQSALGAVRVATRGYAAPEVERAYARALEISRTSPDTPSDFPELWGLWGLHLARAELDRALQLCARIETIADASGDRLMRLQAHHALWMTHFFRGELVAAFHHVETGEPLYDAAADRQSGLIYGHDAKAAAMSYRAILEWSFGRIDHALDVEREAVAHARALGHPMSLAFGLVNTGWLRLRRREPDAGAAQAAAVIAHAIEQQVPFWMAHGLLMRGWALSERGELGPGIADIEEGLASMGAAEAGLGRTAHYANLAAAKGRAGDLAAARALMEQAKALVAATGERYFEPEIHRLDAELVLAEAGGVARAPAKARARADASLHAAVECAQRQGSRTMELRITTTLARLRGHGATARATRARLADLVAGFTEGAGTADVADARRLLAD
jgi:predicted ATPase